MKIFTRKAAVTETPDRRAHRLELIETMTFEVVPLKSLDAAIADLPPGASVSITCSPNKGIEVTQEITERLLTDGYDAIPHISSRMVRDQTHTKELADWFRSTGVRTAFIVGGDADPPGGYVDSIEFLTDLLDTDHGLATIGVTAYPDSHTLIPTEKLHDALHAKQRLLDEAGVDGYCSTQMCFDPSTISDWIRRERAAGLTLPIHLGISGVVDKTKLMTMGVRLGIGTSLSYLRKNRTAVTRLLTSPAYDPNDLLVPLSADLLEHGVTGLHVFTFNQVGATEAWREGVLADT